MLRDGFLTEGSSTNIIIVKDSRVIAPRKTAQILPGITYDAVFDIAQAHGVATERRPIAESQLRAADEILLSSSGREVLAITSLDGQAVGNGLPGPLYRRLRTWFDDAKRADARAWQAERAQRKLAA